MIDRCKDAKVVGSGGIKSIRSREIIHWSYGRSGSSGELRGRECKAHLVSAKVLDRNLRGSE